MFRRLTATIQVLRYSESTTRDVRGNRTRSYAAPVPMDVYTIYPRTSTEPDEYGRRPVVTGMTVLAPISAEGNISAHDRVVLPDGLTYEVSGNPGVWKYNPHARNRVNECVQIELERTEG